MLLADRMIIGHSVLNQCRTFAVVGVSQDKQKYGYEIFETLLNKGYKVYPVNPKYTSVDGQPCYPSLRDLPEKPEVVVTATPPAVIEKVAETCAHLSIRILWMPPETWTEKSIEICKAHGVQEIHDICLVLALKSLTEGKNMISHPGITSPTIHIDPFQAAQRLGNLLSETPEFKAFLAASKAVHNDGTIQKLSAEMRAHQTAVHWNRDPDDKHAAELTRLELVIEDLPVMKEYREREKEVSVLFQAVDKIVSQEAGLDFAVNAQHSDCNCNG